MPKRLIPVVIVLICATALPAQATIILDLSIEQMTKAAPLVLIGEVRGIHTAYNPARTKIYTWINVTPTEVLKGRDPGATVTVKVIGGQVGNTIADMRGAPRFDNGERVLLFLEPRQDGDGYLTIGMFMGKFRLLEDATSGELMLHRPAPERGVHLAGQVNGGARETILLLNEVRDIVNRAGGAR